MGSTLAVVLISAYADVPMAVRAMRSGAVTVIEKPYKNDDLADAVRKALDDSASGRLTVLAFAKDASIPGACAARRTARTNKGLSWQAATEQGNELFSRPIRRGGTPSTRSHLRQGGYPDRRAYRSRGLRPHRQWSPRRRQPPPAAQLQVVLPRKVWMFFGGPVAGPLMALHTRAALGERQLLAGVFFSGKRKNVLDADVPGAQPCKIFAGYAGWGPGQLDYEVEQGVWRVVPATPEQIFRKTVISGSSFHGRLPGCACGPCSTSGISRQTHCGTEIGVAWSSFEANIGSAQSTATESMKDGALW